MESRVAAASIAVPVAAAAATAAEEKGVVMVAIDDSGESYYALQWVLDNLFGWGEDEYLLTIIHVMEPFPHYILPGAPGTIYFCFVKICVRQSDMSKFVR